MFPRHTLIGYCLVALISSNCLLSTLAYAYPPQMISPTISHQATQGGAPPLQGGFVPARVPQLPSQRVERKFAEKPNAMKKVALDDLDDIQTNQISDGGFSWSNMLAMVMQMLFNGGGNNQGPTKSESLDDGGVAPSPWANLLSVGLKILTAILGGGGNSDGIDKVDNGSPMQGILAVILSTVLGAKDPDQVATMAKQAGEFINIVVNLLDALKTSFSHRSMTARTLGKKDSVSDAALAGIAMAKSYVRSLATSDDKCMQKYVCEANRECMGDVGQTSIFCQLGTYATSFILERSAGGTFDMMYEAGRRGRSGDNCRQVYLECNEV